MNDNIQNNKRIAKNTILLYVRMLLLMVVSLFTSRINLQALGVEDFGIYNVVGGFVAMFSMLSGALSVSISRNISYEIGTGNKQKLAKVFSTSINIQIGIAIIILLLAETIGVWFLNNIMVIPSARMYAANWVLQFSVISFLVGLLNAPYNAAIIAHEQMSAFAYISILEAILKLGVAYLLYISPIDKLITFSALLALVAIMLRQIYASYCRRHFEECVHRWFFDWELMKNMLGFAGWSMFGLVAYTGYTYGLNIILNLFFGPAVNAARGIAVQVQNAVQGFSQNFQMAINPQIIKSYASGCNNRVYELIFASSKYVYFLLLFFAIPIIIEAPIILELWLGVVPEHTVNFLRLIMVIITIDSLGSPISTAQQATGNIKNYQIVVGGIMLLIVPVAYIVLKLGGTPESVYWVYLAACVAAHILRLIIIHRMIQLSVQKYLKDVLAPIAAVTVLAFALPIIVYENVSGSSVVSFVCVVATSFVSVLISVYWLGLNKKERQFVNIKLMSCYRSLVKHGTC